MSRKIYVDANVFISYWDMEYGRNLTDYLEYFSGQILERALGCEFEICVSDLVVKEIEKVFRVTKEKVHSLLSGLETANKLRYVYGSDGIWRRAHEINRKYRTHLADAVHAAFAEREKAVLVTWNIKDFVNLDFLDAKTPKKL